MRFFVVKMDDRIHNAIHINIKKEELNVLREGVIDCDLGENKCVVDYLYIRRLFSTFHFFSDELKELLEIYEETLLFYPVFLCDLLHMKQLVFWKCSCEMLDCVVDKKYKSIEEIELKSKFIENHFLFKIAFEKQEYFVFELTLVENILRREIKGIHFMEIFHYQ